MFSQTGKPPPVPRVDRLAITPLPTHTGDPGGTKCRSRGPREPHNGTVGGTEGPNALASCFGPRSWGRASLRGHEHPFGPLWDRVHVGRRRPPVGLRGLSWVTRALIHGRKRRGTFLSFSDTQTGNRNCYYPCRLPRLVHPPTWFPDASSFLFFTIHKKQCSSCC